MLEPDANATNKVPITQAIKAFLAVCTFSGAPAAVKYKIPATTQPINTTEPPIVTKVSLSFPAIAVKVEPSPKAVAGRNIALNKIKDNIFLFT